MNSSAQATRPSFEADGVVKNYDKDRHFGFVVPEGDSLGSDIFIDGRCLEKSGIKNLTEGTRVRCKGFIRKGKGPKARRLKILP
jgi:cold shock CspA family protein